MWVADSKVAVDNSRCANNPAACQDRRYEYVLGIDEAGRGCMAGPVAVSAVLLRANSVEKMPFSVDDSKKLTENKRRTIMSQLLEALSSDSTDYQCRCFEKNNAVTIHPCPIMSRGTQEVAPPAPSTSHAVGKRSRSKGSKNRKIEKQPSSSKASCLPRVLGMATWLISSQQVDEINVSNASLEGMSAACHALVVNAKRAQIPLSSSNTRIFLDGAMLPWTFLSPSEREKLRKKKTKKPAEEQRIRGKHYPELDVFSPAPVVKGDQKLYCIAAASIVSKVVRDAYCDKIMDVKFPEYEFKQHKGYCTSLHKQLLEKLGPTPFHRRTFKPVTEVTEAGKKSGTRKKTLSKRRSKERCKSK